MSSIYESTNYNLSYRGILTNNEFKLYTTNNSINISSEISFDINADYKSSINYFATSILGGIAHSLIRQSKKNNIEIEELEGKIYINLKNPLTLIGVKGYNDEPKTVENMHEYIEKEGYTRQGAKLRYNLDGYEKYLSSLGIYLVEKKK